MSAVNAIIKSLARTTFSLLLLLCCFNTLVSTANAANGEEGKAKVKVVAILTADELGDNFKFPSFLTYDTDMDEIYVVAGGAGKVIVYNSNFFPTVSLGPGRSANAPRGIYVHDDGMIYLCQGLTYTQPGRLTIFNSAFFPVQEITFEGMPGTENFIPQDVIVGLTGNIYVVGLTSRGILVLDKDGEFSHWLQPRDQIFDLEAVEADRKAGDQDELELTDVGMMSRGKSEGQEEPPDMAEFLPPELIPESDTTDNQGEKTKLGPVMVMDIVKDSEGHLYLLSEETSKVYVYSPFEEFLYSFGEKGGSTGKMSRPRSLVVDEKRKAIFIADYMRHSILIFDQGGKFMYEFGGRGVGAGWFRSPTGLAMNREGQLLVADLFNNRVQIMDIQFEYKFPLFSPSEGEKPQIRDDVQREPPPPPTGETDEADDILEPVPL